MTRLASWLLFVVIAATGLARGELRAADPIPPELLADLKTAIAKPGTPADDRLQRAMVVRENEPLAGEMVRAARDLYRRGERGNPVRNLMFFISRRSGDKDLLIDGPYLKDYSELIYEICEAELFGKTGWGLATSYRPLLVYLKAHPEDKDLRVRTTRLASKFAKYSKLPPKPEMEKPGESWEHRSWAQVSFAWNVLFALDELKDGMTLDEVKPILGEPTQERSFREGITYIWLLPTGFRRITALQAQDVGGKLKFYGYAR